MQMIFIIVVVVCGRFGMRLIVTVLFMLIKKDSHKNDTNIEHNKREINMKIKRMNKNNEKKTI